MVILLALPLLVLAVMLLASMFDVELKPEIVELVRRIETERIAENGNAYFALVGLEAPSGENIFEAGKRIHEEDLRQLETFREGLAYKTTGKSEPTNFVKFKGNASSICSVINNHLYENGVCKFQAETEQMLLNNRELLARYYELIQNRFLEEPVLAQMWMANNVISLEQLAQADIERKLQGGELSKAAALLTRDLAFWQGLYQGKYRLISEAVLQVGYGFRIGAISELVLRWPKLLQNAELKAVIAKPLPRGPSILQAQMDREFMNLYFVRDGSELVFNLPTENDRKSAEWWFGNRFYRKNATLNAFHACLKKFYAVRALTGPEQERAVQSLSNYEPSVLGLVTNLTGEIGLYSACPKRSWLQSIDDSRPEARRILVALQTMLLERKIRESAIPVFLENTDLSLRDPRTGQAAMWDPRYRVVYFTRRDGPQFTGLWVRLDQKGGFEGNCPDARKPPCQD